MCSLIKNGGAENAVIPIRNASCVIFTSLPPLRKKKEI